MNVLNVLIAYQQLWSLFRKHVCAFSRAVVKQVTELDVAGKLPTEAEINDMVNQLRDGINALVLEVRLFLPQ